MIDQDDLDGIEGTMKRPLDDDNEYSDDGSKRHRVDGPRVELKLLLQSKNAGAIIGKGGSNIKRLRVDYKASISIPDSNGPERIISINGELGCVLDVLMEIVPCLEDYRSKHSDYDGEIRMVVHQSQAGCIIGRAGFKIKELREQTRAGIKVFSTCCPNSTDRVVSITGKRKDMVGCVEVVMELLQSAPPKGPIQPYDPSFYDEFAAPEYGGFVSSDSRGGNGMPRGGSMSLGPSMRSNMRSGGRMGGVDDFGMMGGGFGGGRMNDFSRDFGGLHGGIGGMSSRMDSGYRGMGDSEGLGMRSGGFGGSRNSGMRSSMNRGGSLLEGFGGNDHGGNMHQSFHGDSLNLGSGQGLSFGDDGTDTTQVTIPKDMAGAIIGKGGSRITEIRRCSGAQIVIDEALPGSSERIISITGNQDQIQNAQYLLQLSVKQQGNLNY